eukprot:TRINITY_DN5497_c0_g1_i1.p2 TRINITY_DN5497_c0_g1~~TRINITY_DN5497_c0_g1_i1.p2  ORF type:complete len:161 (-),score=66.24 TRINITY_DN5497_c0_g1_i1:343-825(-)
MLEKIIKSEANLTKGTLFDKIFPLPNHNYDQFFVSAPLPGDHFLSSFFSASPSEFHINSETIASVARKESIQKKKKEREKKEEMQRNPPKRIIKSFSSLSPNEKNNQGNLSNRNNREESNPIVQHSPLSSPNLKRSPRIEPYEHYVMEFNASPRSSDIVT